MGGERKEVTQTVRGLARESAAESESACREGKKEKKGHASSL